MNKTTTENADLRIQLKRVVEDLFEPNPLIYWTDFLISLAGVYACLVLLSLYSLSWISATLLFVAGTLFLYRCSAFLHEIVHRKPSQLPGFRTAYSLFFGFPFCLPEFFYSPHLDHHSPRHFSTNRDPEYAGWKKAPLWEFFAYIFVSVLVFPFLLIVRFTLLQYLTLVLGKNYRNSLTRKHSTLGTTRAYERTIRSKREIRSIVFQEWMTSLYCTGLLVSVVSGFLPWQVLGFWYLMLSHASALNFCRGSVNHGYHLRDKATGMEQMISDSVNIVTNSIWSWFWSPLDSKYHRLHHLFPRIPYHSLETAHLRLANSLPTDHPYLILTKKSFPHAFADLILDRENLDQKQKRDC